MAYQVGASNGVESADQQVLDWQAAQSLLVDDSGNLNIANAALDRLVKQGQGQAPALICLGKHYERQIVTFAQLAEQSGRMARALVDLGLNKGDAVAVLMGRSANLYVAAHGIWKAGGVFCPLFAAFGPGPIRSRIELAGAKVLITTAETYARKIAPYRELLPHLQSVILLGSDEYPVDRYEGCLDFDQILANTPPMEAVATSAEDPAFVHFTSGTAGTPKGAVHTHRAAIAHLATGLAVFNLTPNDVFWCTADPGWITSTAYALIAPLLCGAPTVVDEADFDPRRWYGVLKDEKVTVWYTTPTNIRIMMRFGAALARIYRENSLRLAASVGEPLNAEAAIWGERSLGVPFLDTWWQTETGSITIANLPGQGRAGSMGVPLPGITAGVFRRNLSSVEELTDVDAVGELGLKADIPSLFTRYLGDDGRFGACFVDGWYLTGDLVRRDKDGYFWFVGRSDDMIKSSGYTVGPFEIESALMNHPAVAEIGVVGKPDLLLREVPVAFVSLNPGFEEGDALRVELLAYARQELGATMAPREMFFVETLPKTTTGKILRRALKSQAVAEAEGDNVILAPPVRFDQS